MSVVLQFECSVADTQGHRFEVSGSVDIMAVGVVLKG